LTSFTSTTSIQKGIPVSPEMICRAKTGVIVKHTLCSDPEGSVLVISGFYDEISLSKNRKIVILIGKEKEKRGKKEFKIPFDTTFPAAIGTSEY